MREPFLFAYLLCELNLRQYPLKVDKIQGNGHRFVILDAARKRPLLAFESSPYREDAVKFTLRRNHAQERTFYGPADIPWRLGGKRVKAHLVGDTASVAMLSVVEVIELVSYPYRWSAAPGVLHEVGRLPIFCLPPLAKRSLSFVQLDFIDDVRSRVINHEKLAFD